MRLIIFNCINHLLHTYEPKNIDEKSYHISVVFSKQYQRSRIIEPRHEISYNVVYVTSQASDPPAHMRSLIRAFASRLDML